MAITEFFVLENGLLAEFQIGGLGLRAYGIDALGSVVETFDTAGAKENTYAFGGYGTLLAKSGLASDPWFLWNGTHGYLATGRLASEYYVRTRHYSSLLGSWVATDPLWPQEPPYRYVSSNPTSHSDYSGMASNVLPVAPSSWYYSATGPYKTYVTFNWPMVLRPPGWVVQKITRTAAVTTCKGEVVPLTHMLYYQDPNSTFYEAWCVGTFTNGAAKITAFSNNCSSSAPEAWDQWSVDDDFSYLDMRVSGNGVGKFIQWTKDMQAKMNDAFGPDHGNSKSCSFCGSLGDTSQSVSYHTRDCPPTDCRVDWQRDPKGTPSFENTSHCQIVTVNGIVHTKSTLE
jgi:RHS repeat-associated protein